MATIGVHSNNHAHLIKFRESAHYTDEARCTNPQHKQTRTRAIGSKNELVRQAPLVDLVEANSHHLLNFV